MKLFDLFERSVPMKQKNIETGSNNRTIGFEVEIAIDPEMYEEKKNDILQSYNIYDFYKDYFMNDLDNVESLLEDSKAKPIFGFASPKEKLEQEERNNPKYFGKIREIMKQRNKLRKNPSEEKLNEVLNLVQETIYDTGLINTVMNDELSLKSKIDKFISLTKERLPSLPENKSGEIDITLLYDSRGNIHEAETLNLSEILDLIKNKEDFLNLLENIYENTLEQLTDEDNNMKKTQTPLLYIEEKMRNTGYTVEMNPNYVSQEILYDTWKVEFDSSIKPSGGEIKSPIFYDINTGIDELKKILTIIKHDNYMFTNNSTGLHVNIGNIDKDNIDLLKFSILIGEEHVTNYFERSNNKNALSVVKDLHNYYSYEEVRNRNIDKVIREINNIIIPKMPGKDRFLNMQPLEENNYIEIRGFGGDNYEYKQNAIINYIKKIGYVLDLSENPNAYRDAYLKKLTKIISQNTTDKNEVKEMYPLSVSETKYFFDIIEKHIDTNVLNALKEKQNFMELINNFYSFRDLLALLIRNNLKFDNKLAKIIYKLFNELINNDTKAKNKDNVEELYNIIYNDATLRNLFDKYILPKYSS